MSAQQRLGRFGEELALRFLETCGYRCLDRRYRRPGGEIDLVLRRGDVLVFVEVKTRGSGSPAPAEYWFHGRQLQRQRKLARRWLQENGGAPPGGCRFDLVAVDFEGEELGLRLRHLAGIA